MSQSNVTDTMSTATSVTTSHKPTTTETTTLTSSSRTETTELTTTSEPTMSATNSQTASTSGTAKKSVKTQKSDQKPAASKQSNGKKPTTKKKSGAKSTASRPSTGKTPVSKKSGGAKSSVATTGKVPAATKKSGPQSKQSASGTKPAAKKKSVAPKKSTATTGKPGTAGTKKSLNPRKRSVKSKSSVKTKKSVASQKSTSSKKSKDKGKAKKGKVKVKKLNRKAIYKAIKLVEKQVIEEEKRKKRLDWEKNKIVFYWNCTVGKLEDLNKRNCHLKKKKESQVLEKNHALFHEYWRKMNQTRIEREEALDGKRGEFRSMVLQLKESQKRQADTLFKGIQNYVRDTYLVGEKYMSDTIGIRMDYTKWMTETLFEAREQSRLLEIEQNAKYSPALEAFEQEMRRLRSRIPKERQERLQQFLVESNGMLVELVGVYTNILHHNFNEVCHTANIINQLKTKERRLLREKNDSVKRLTKVKERTDHLQERISNLKRQVNVGREGRKKLMRVMRDQAFLHKRNDIAYINRELTYQENARLTQEVEKMSERVDKWYFRVKRNFLKKVIVEADKFKERALQLTNYNRLIKHLFDVEDGFLEAVETFKDHEEFDNAKEGLKVLLGGFKPFTLEELEKDFEGCTESFATAIVFFKQRLHQNYLSLDDLHFFIKRRNPLSYLGTSKREKKRLLNELSYAQQGKLSLGSSYTTSNISTVSFRL